MEKNEDHLGTRAKFAFGLCSVAAGLLAGSIAAPAVASDTPFASPQSFDIPSQPLDSALTELADRAGLKLLYRADTARQARSHKVAGNYTPQQALDIMLHDTGLSYRLTDDGALTIEKPRTELSTESLLAAAGEFELVKAEPEEKPWTGPVEQLDMKVIGGDLSRYIEVDSTAGTKFPIDITRVPQSVQVINEEAIKDQGAQSIGDIMKQVPSANVFGSRFTGGFPSVSIRGFRAEQTRNGVRQLYFSDVDFSSLSHIQSVEVLKGPGGNLFGQTSAFEGSPGGIINVITKRPYDRLGADVSFTRGGWTGFAGDITSGQWDFNVPMGAFKARFTGEVESLID